MNYLVKVSGIFLLKWTALLTLIKTHEEKGVCSRYGSLRQVGSVMFTCCWTKHRVLLGILRLKIFPGVKRTTSSQYLIGWNAGNPPRYPRLSVFLSPTKGLLHCQSCGSSLLSVRKPSESKSIFFMIDFSLLCCSSGVSLTYSSTSSFGE